jgi:selenocysteine lyase/cysteine desulfurase
MEAKTDEARKLFAEMVGADADEIGFLYSTSQGENVVVNSLDFKPGDNMVFDNIAYRQRSGVEMRIVRNRNGAATVEDLRSWSTNVRG